MHLKDLKQKSPKELLTQAEELGIEDASSMRVQDLIFAIMKKVASDDQTIYGEGTIEVLQDGFGFLRSAESNYLASPDDIYGFAFTGQKIRPAHRRYRRRRNPRSKR